SSPSRASRKGSSSSRRSGSASRTAETASSGARPTSGSASSARTAGRSPGRTKGGSSTAARAVRGRKAGPRGETAGPRKAPERGSLHPVNDGFSMGSPRVLLPLLPPPEAAEERDECTVEHLFVLHPRGLPPHQEEALPIPVPHRDQHPSPLGELPDQRLRDLRRGRRHQDRVVGGVPAP